MRNARWLLAALAALLSPAAAAQGLLAIDFRLEAGAQPGRGPPGPEITEIVITGERLRGSARGDAAPLYRLDERDVAAFGVGTIGELVEALAPQTRGAGPGAPVVLVNGQRIAGFAEVRELPAEAVERIDILPEEVALRYGYRADRRVVNLVLRPRFRAVTAEATAGAATGGGRRSGQAEVTVSRIGPEGRWNLYSRYRRAEALLESERDLEGGLGSLRTLLPRTEQATLGGSFTRTIARDVPATLTARLEASESEARIGAAPGAGNAGLGPVRRTFRSRSANLGLAANGPLGEWQWSFTGSADFSRSDTRTHLPDRPGRTPPDSTRSDFSLVDAQLLASGGLFPLPAGEAQATLTLDAGRTVQSSRALAAGAGERSRLTRGRALAQAAFDLPLTGPGFLGGAGRLAATFQVGVETLSDFGTLRRLGYGLRWAPSRRVSLSALVRDDDRAPNMPDLAAPPLLTPNIRLFDFSRGETADVERIDGGNPLLRPERRRSMRIAASIRPLAAHNLALTASYLKSRLTNPIGALPAPSAEIEAAFPERFVRAPDGRLLRIDARPVNFARADREELRWGFVFSRPLAASPLAGAPRTAGDREDLRGLIGERDRSGRLFLSLHHSWRLRERLLVRTGLPRLDLLGGSAGSRPRHELEAQAGFLRDGVGVRLDASWRSARAVTGIPRAGGGAGRLDFSSLARVDLQLFVDLGERPGLVERAPWLRGTRLTLSIGNLFKARQRVRDESGATPLGLQPAYLDPEGRTVRIVLRRLF